MLLQFAINGKIGICGPSFWGSNLDNIHFVENLDSNWPNSIEIKQERFVEKLVDYVFYGDFIEPSHITYDGKSVSNENFELGVNLFYSFILKNF